MYLSFDEMVSNLFFLFCISEQIAANIALEIKRMQRRKQLQYPSQSSSPPPMSSSPPPPSLEGCSTLSSSTSSEFFNALSPSKKETPLFTFKQVSLVCERMLKEREDKIRQEYDKVLTCKLAGQWKCFSPYNKTTVYICVQGALWGIKLNSVPAEVNLASWDELGKVLPCNWWWKDCLCPRYIGSSYEWGTALISTFLKGWVRSLTKLLRRLCYNWTGVVSFCSIIWITPPL